MKSVFFISLFYILSVLSCLGQKNEVDQINLKGGGSVQIEFVKHGSLIIIYEGKRIYVDPSSLFADYSNYPSADVILFTHDHEDHFDTVAVNRLNTKHADIIGNVSVIAILQKGKSMKNGDTLSLLNGKILLEAVPAYNTTPNHTAFHPKGRDNGYVLTVEGTRIYIAGDTEVIPEMSELKNIDIAFLPVNQPYTMTIDQACNAVSLIKPKVFYPYHYGETKVKNLVEKLPKQEIRIRQMQ